MPRSAGTMSFVFVEQATQNGSALDPSVGEVRAGMIRVRREKLKSSMGPSPVVVGAVLGENSS